MLKNTIIVAGALFATTAMAQTAAPVRYVELEDDKASVAALGLTVGQVKDMDIIDNAGNKVAEIEEVLGSDADTATALAIDLETSDIDDDVLIDFGAVELVNNQIVTSLSAEALAALPIWDD
jgi:hypothetical protein